MRDSSPSESATRLSSLDQFRGFAVAGMFVVNFLGGLAVTPSLLKHNNTYFSLADWIMPAFIFASGLSFRMSFVRCVRSRGETAAVRRFVARSGGLILLSLMLFGFGGGFPRAGDMNAENIGRFVAELFRAGLWEVLAIIGAVQLMILPWAGARTGIRVAALIVLAVLHTSLSWSFNFDFVYGRPNWLDGYFGAAGKRCWDGGFFGLLAWSEVMLAGTLAADLMDARRPINTARRLAVLGALLMATGYALSCLTRLYDVVGVSGETPVAGVAASEQLAASPVLPPFSALQGRHWTTLIAEPPFVPPPSSDQRPLNYWMMNKRVVTQSFVLFGTGFSMSLLGAFVAACDRGRMNLTVLRMFGQNPLAAYIIHHFVSETILTVVPDDSPGALAVAGTLVSFGVTWHFVAFLERRRLFLRL